MSRMRRLVPSWPFRTERLSKELYDCRRGAWQAIVPLMILPGSGYPRRMAMSNVSLGLGLLATTHGGWL